MEKSSVNKALRKYYEFDDDDLYANNLGRLTPKQELRFKKRSDDMRKGGLAIAWFFLGLGICIGSIGILVLLISLLDQHWSLGPLASTFIPAIILSGIGGFMYWNSIRSSGSKGTLYRTSGPITISVEEHQSGSVRNGYSKKYKVHYMNFPDGSKFTLDDDLLDYVKEGNDYALNYIMFDDRSGGRVLTMEMV